MVFDATIFGLTAWKAWYPHWCAWSRGLFRVILQDSELAIHMSWRSMHLRICSRLQVSFISGAYECLCRFLDVSLMTLAHRFPRILAVLYLSDVLTFVVCHITASLLFATRADSGHFCHALTARTSKPIQKRMWKMAKLTLMFDSPSTKVYLQHSLMCESWSWSSFLFPVSSHCAFQHVNHAGFSHDAQHTEP